MKQGDVVFFKESQASLSRNAHKVQFKGYGWGVLLGMVPGFLRVSPSPEIVFQAFGAIGLVSFDDVAEFLGEDQVKIVQEKFKVKYTLKMPEATDEKEEPTEIIVPKKLELVDANGIVIPVKDLQ